MVCPLFPQCVKNIRFGRDLLPVHITLCLHLNNWVPALKLYYTVFASITCWPASNCISSHKRTKGSMENFMSYYIPHKTVSGHFHRKIYFQIWQTAVGKISSIRKYILWLGEGGSGVPEGPRLIYWGKHRSVDPHNHADTILWRSTQLLQD